VKVLSPILSLASGLLWSPLVSSRLVSSPLSVLDSSALLLPPPVLAPRLTYRSGLALQGLKARFGATSDPLKFSSGTTKSRSTQPCSLVAGWLARLALALAQTSQRKASFLSLARYACTQPPNHHNPPSPSPAAHSDFQRGAINNSNSKLAYAGTLPSLIPPPLPTGGSPPPRYPALISLCPLHST
jgi:hypothetical protein